MEIHREKLRFRCRICGSKQLGNSTRDKYFFCQSILDIFNVDINQDDPFIHPEKVCRTHEKLLLAYLQAKDSCSKEFTCNVALYDFSLHTDGCSICIPTKVGRRVRKRKQYTLSGNDNEPLVTIKFQRSGETQRNSAIKSDQNALDTTQKDQSPCLDGCDNQTEHCTESLLTTPLNDQDQFESLDNIYICMCVCFCVDYIL